MCRAGRERSIIGRLRPTAYALLSVLVVGCSASVPLDYTKTESAAFPPSDATLLGREVGEWSTDNGGASGFFPLDDGTDALGARLRLIDLAEQSIDAQYFIFSGDIAGSLFAASLLRAADRGVRVRLLIDDSVAFRGLDAEITQLSMHPNMDVRLFNPISRDGLVAVNFAASFERANRRMHNKSFTVDNAATIVGGRNIADEYFRMSEGEFIDFEVLGIGPVAADVSESFDLFWNDEFALPVEAFEIDTDEAEFAQLRRELESVMEEQQTGYYGRAVNSPFVTDLFDRKIEPIFAAHKVVTDSPEKLRQSIDLELEGLAAELRRVLDEAQEEVIILTPYLVPGTGGVEIFSDIRARGVRVAFVTNSLAATDQVAVHSGYVAYRQALLKAGIELYEIKVDALSIAEPESPESSNLVALHSKTAVIDRKIMFIGSLNMDPRSIDINSEMGIFLTSSRAAGEYVVDLEEQLPVYAYRLGLDNAGSVVWHYEGGGNPVTMTSEPDVDAWRAFGSDFLGILPLEDQL